MNKETFECSVGQLHEELANTKMRLQHKFDWSDDFINHSINEYWRFLYLRKTVNPTKTWITPGNIIDDIWHDHILHTRSYTTFCETYFGYYLHHTPKNLAEDEDYSNSITMTKKLYKDNFGHEPPSDIWFPDPKQPTPHVSSPKSTSYDPGCCRCG